MRGQTIVKDILGHCLKTTAFSIHIDENTVVDNTALVMGYVPYFNDNCTIKEDSMFVKLMETDKTGIYIFKTLFHVQCQWLGGTRDLSLI